MFVAQLQFIGVALQNRFREGGLNRDGDHMENAVAELANSPGAPLPWWGQALILILFFGGGGCLWAWWENHETNTLKKFAKRFDLDYFEFDTGGVVINSEFKLNALGPMGADIEIRATLEGMAKGYEIAVVYLGYTRLEECHKRVGYPIPAFRVTIEGADMPLFHVRPEKMRHKGR